MPRNISYIGSIWGGLKNSFSGLALTFRHFKKGYKTRTPVGVEKANYFEEADQNVTIQYPKEKIPIPDLGRYRL
ncbi:MAG: 4Fe-4S ferredoxin, partial [Bacteroidota bacterium]